MMIGFASHAFNKISVDTHALRDISLLPASLPQVLHATDVQDDPRRGGNAGAHTPGISGADEILTHATCT